jgi:hypothetical protein
LVIICVAICISYACISYKVPFIGIQRKAGKGGKNIASKSGDVEISRRVVEIKTAIDRIKEQAQNAE